MSHFVSIFRAKFEFIFPLLIWWANTRVLVSRATDPNWCAAPRATGTLYSIVMIPKVACNETAAIIAFAAIMGDPVKPAFLDIIHDAPTPNTSRWANSRWLNWTVAWFSRSISTNQSLEFCFSEFKTQFQGKITIFWGKTWKKRVFSVKIRYPIRKRHSSVKSWVHWLPATAN